MQWWDDTHWCFGWLDFHSCEKKRCITVGTRESPEIFTEREADDRDLVCFPLWRERETVRWLIGLSEKGGGEGREGREGRQRKEWELSVERDSTQQQRKKYERETLKRRTSFSHPSQHPFPSRFPLCLCLLCFRWALVPLSQSSLFSKFPLSFLPFFLFRAVLLRVFLPITGSFTVLEGNSRREQRENSSCSARWCEGESVLCIYASLQWRQGWKQWREATRERFRFNPRDNDWFLLLQSTRASRTRSFVSRCIRSLKFSVSLSLSCSYRGEKQEPMQKIEGLKKERRKRNKSFPSLRARLSLPFLSSFHPPCFPSSLTKIQSLFELFELSSRRSSDNSCSLLFSEGEDGYSRKERERWDGSWRSTRIPREVEM